MREQGLLAGKTKIWVKMWCWLMNRDNMLYSKMELLPNGYKRL